MWPTPCPEKSRKTPKPPEEEKVNIPAVTMSAALTPWTQLCLRQADCLIVIRNADIVVAARS